MSTPRMSEDVLRYERTWPAVGCSSLKEVFAAPRLWTRFVERTLRRSIEDVYDHVADFANHAAFLPAEQVRQWRVLTDPPWGVGTRIDFEGRISPQGWQTYRAVCISDVPLRMIALKLLDAPFEHIWAYTFAGKEGVCTVRLYSGIAFANRFSFLQALAHRPILRRLHRRTLDNLKSWAEPHGM